MKKRLTFVFILFLFLGNKSLYSQSENASPKYIQALLNQDSLDKAKTILESRVSQLLEEKNYDQLSTYLYLKGKVAESFLDKSQAKNQVTALADQIISHSHSDLTLFTTYENLALFYSETGQMPLAYENSKKAKKYAKKLTSINSKLDNEYNLAEYSMKMGDFNLFEKHIRKSVSIISNYPNKKLKRTSKVYNLMGGLMFFSSKSDSATYYFEKALANIKNLEDLPKNKYYLPAAIKGNIVMLKQNEGKFDEAIALEKEANILNFKFLKNNKYHPLATNAKRNIAIGYLGLASLYNDLGDYENAEKFSNILYQFTKENFASNTQEYFTAVLNIAESNLYKNNFVQAEKYLNEAEITLGEVSGENFQLHAHLYGLFGNLCYKQRDKEKSIKYYLLASDYYNKAHEGVYSRDRLYALMNLAIVSAEAHKKEIAIKAVDEAYNNYPQINNLNNQLTIAILETYSSVYFDLGDFKKSKEWSEKALEKYDTKKGIISTHDIALFDVLKIKTIVLHARSRYELAKNKDINTLQDIINEVNRAVLVYENRKSLVSSIDDVNTSIENNKDVFDFLKKLHFELYQQTKEPRDLKELINLQESSTYNRIQTRLNIHEDISFSGVPKEVLAHEKALKEKIQNSLSDQENNEGNVQEIIANNLDWVNFLDSLKVTFPKYYKMRYASMEKNIGDIKKMVPDNTTFVRYFYIDEDLKAYLVDKNQEILVSLSTDQLTEKIKAINSPSFEQKNLQLYNDLYNQLWKPFEDKIQTNRIVIIPDGELFNISFESLTTIPISSNKDFLTNSLLAHYSISYNYSLFLLNSANHPTYFEKNFVAFAPEFTDKMKENYKIALVDSNDLDQTYLHLLPQPFCAELIKNYSKVFDGTSFMNEKSTEQVFKNSAKEHKIIHIGTHAESNNISPEFSRLIFAKDISDSTSMEDNSLYAYEIYDCNLTCNLAILTACETGKPSYQAGEGMISLAHAFNYAGSESILTSLWKIDEKSSAKIINNFYTNITAELPKDEALRQAKLSYLETSNGRLLHPQYWAGLVLIGNSSPIKINAVNTPSPWKYWLLGGVLLIVLLVLLRKKR